MDFARRRQRQAALGSINLGFIAAIICLRIFEGCRAARGNHRWVGKGAVNRDGKNKKGKRRRGDTRGRKGKSNREQTIYRALNYFIRSGGGVPIWEWQTRTRTARTTPPPTLCTRLPWKLINETRRIYWSFDSEWLVCVTDLYSESFVVVERAPALESEQEGKRNPIVNWSLVTAPILEIINLPWYLSRLSLLRKIQLCTDSDLTESWQKTANHACNRVYCTVIACTTRTRVCRFINHRLDAYSKTCECEFAFTVSLRTFASSWTSRKTSCLKSVFFQAHSSRKSKQFVCTRNLRLYFW